MQESLIASISPNLNKPTKGKGKASANTDGIVNLTPTLGDRPVEARTP